MRDQRRAEVARQQFSSDSGVGTSFADSENDDDSSEEEEEEEKSNSNDFMQDRQITENCSEYQERIFDYDAKYINERKVLVEEIYDEEAEKEFEINNTKSIDQDNVNGNNNCKSASTLSVETLKEIEKIEESSVNSENSKSIILDFDNDKMKTVSETAAVIHLKTSVANTIDTELNEINDYLSHNTPEIIEKDSEEMIIEIQENKEKAILNKNFGVLSDDHELKLEDIKTDNENRQDLDKEKPYYEVLDTSDETEFENF